jgi:hypothetical protein
MSADIKAVSTRLQQNLWVLSEDEKAYPCLFALTLRLLFPNYTRYCDISKVKEIYDFSLAPLE